MTCKLLLFQKVLSNSCQSHNPKCPHTCTSTSQNMKLLDFASSLVGGVRALMGEWLQEAKCQRNDQPMRSSQVAKSYLVSQPFCFMPTSLHQGLKADKASEYFVSRPLSFHATLPKDLGLGWLKATLPRVLAHATLFKDWAWDG